MLVQLQDRPFRGIAKAREIAPDGRIVNRVKPLAVQLPASCGAVATTGTVWQVEGESTIRTFMRGSYRVEQEVVQVRSAQFQRPSGELLARWIAANVAGIGEVIARRLLRALPDVDRCVRDGNIEALTGVAGLSQDRAQALVEHWPSEGLYDVLAWLQDADLPIGLSERLCRAYGKSVVAVLRQDPFLLLGFGIPYRRVLKIAQSLGIDEQDERVLVGLAEHAAAQFTAQTGSTVITKASLLRQMNDSSINIAPVALARAPELACAAGALVAVPGGYQALGHAVMERSVARFLTSAATRAPGEGALFAGWEKYTGNDAISKALTTYENSLSYTLTDEQRSVVIAAVRHSVVVVTGEAGTGKTTLVRAILAVYETLAQIPVIQVALSGRAARRMAEATGRPASTIAKCIADHLGDHKPDLPPHLLVVVDEASMLDILSAYRLFGILPDATRLILVGDPAQLPPVSPGVVFHALTNTHLPVLKLTQVKRQRVDSGIYRVAAAIRRGAVPDFPPLRDGLAQVSDVIHTASIDTVSIGRLWQQAGGADRAIILSPIKKGEGGTNGINTHLQRVMGQDRPLLHYQDDTRGWIPWIGPQGQTLYLNDRVMVTVNDYEADIRNGDLGTITQVFDAPSGEGCVGLAEIDGRDVPLTVDVLPSLTLGYAITVHKSQGSQWPVCILMLPMRAIRMTDRSLLYTAVTRATERLVMCGDLKLLEQAVQRDAISSCRESNLPALLA